MRKNSLLQNGNQSQVRDTSNSASQAKPSQATNFCTNFAQYSSLTHDTPNPCPARFPIVYLYSSIASSCTYLREIDLLFPQFTLTKLLLSQSWHGRTWPFSPRDGRVGSSPQPPRTRLPRRPGVLVPVGNAQPGPLTFCQGWVLGVIAVRPKLHKWKRHC